jgi:hypothetical protein
LQKTTHVDPPAEVPFFKLPRESLWLFSSVLVSFGEGKACLHRRVSKSSDEHGNRKHADESGSIENVMMKIERRIPGDQGQEVHRLTKEEKSTLASSMC